MITVLVPHGAAPDGGAAGRPGRARGASPAGAAGQGSGSGRGAGRRRAGGNRPAGAGRASSGWWRSRRAELRARRPAELTLAVAAGDRERFAWMVEKAVELGVTRIVPLETERTAGVATRLRDAHLDAAPPRGARGHQAVRRGLGASRSRSRCRWRSSRGGRSAGTGGWPTRRRCSRRPRSAGPEPGHGGHRSRGRAHRRASARRSCGAATGRWRWAAIRFDSRPRRWRRPRR